MVFIIREMMVQLAFFVLILLVLWFGFGVCTQSLMYFNQKLDEDLLKNVFFPSYFIIGGEYYTKAYILNAGNFNFYVIL